MADGDRLADRRGNPVGLGLLPVKYGSPTVPMPGYDLQVLDDAGQPVKRGRARHARRQAAAAARLPADAVEQRRSASAQATSTEFPGYYTTADAGYIDEDGYAYVMARTDDIINVAGHRLSTGRHGGGGGRAIRTSPNAPWSAWPTTMKGQVPRGFIVLNAGVARPADEIEGEVVKLVRERIGPVAAFKTVMAVKRLPKTRSGKILRGTMRKIADGEDWKMPATIDDPAILDEITAALAARGIGG